MSATCEPADDLAWVMRFLPDQVMVWLIGELDLVTANILEWLLGALADHGRTRIVLDMSAVGFIDGSGLQVIAEASHRLSLLGGGLTLRSPSSRTRWLLDRTGVSGLVHIELPDPFVPRVEPPRALPDCGVVRPPSPQQQHLDLAYVGVIAARHGLVGGVLDVVAALTKATVAMAEGVSVSLPRDGRLATVAASDVTVAQLDRDQYAAGHGPCIDAATTGEQVHAPSLVAEARWPDFVPAARSMGIGSILSTPIVGPVDRPVGSLNIYSRTACAFGDGEIELAALFATQASRIIADAWIDISAEEAAHRLQASLGVRELIAEAKGVIMAREGVSSEAAYAVLRRSSTAANVSLRQHAAEIVASTQQQDPLTESST